MNRVFVDMDGVIADFDRLVRESGVSADELPKQPGAFRGLQPIEGAQEAVEEIFCLGYDVWVASRPAPSHPLTYSDKAAWIIEHFPDLKKKLIFTQDKGLLGEKGDFLIDDRPHKANCVAFPGYLIHFAHAGESPIRVERWFGVPDWTRALQVLEWLQEK